MNNNKNIQNNNNEVFEKPVFMDEKEIDLSNLLKGEREEFVYIIGRENEGPCVIKNETCIIKKYVSEDGLSIKTVMEKADVDADNEIYTEHFKMFGDKKLPISSERCYVPKSKEPGVVSVKLDTKNTEYKYDEKGRIIKYWSNDIEDARIGENFTVTYDKYENGVETSTYRNEDGKSIKVNKFVDDLLIYTKNVTYLSNGMLHISEITCEYDNKKRIIKSKIVGPYETTIDIKVYDGDICITRTTATTIGETKPDRVNVYIVNTKTNKQIYSNVFNHEMVTTIDIDADTGISTETLKILLKVPNDKGSMEEIKELTKRSKSGKKLYRFIRGNECSPDYEEFYEYDADDKLIKVTYPTVGMVTYICYDEDGVKDYEKTVHLCKTLGDTFRAKETFTKCCDNQKIVSTIYYYDKKEA